MATADPRIKATVARLLLWLIAGDYLSIEQTTKAIRLSADLLRQAVADYGRTLIMLPPSELNQLDVIEIVDSNPKAWSISVALWTAEEGRSDLSLECTLFDCEGDFLRVEVDNLHVL